jgi:hypothetical protein
MSRRRSQGGGIHDGDGAAFASRGGQVQGRKAETDLRGQALRRHRR